MPCSGCAAVLNVPAGAAARFDCPECATVNERGAAKKMCEGCQLKAPSFGLPAEGKKRWCGGCAKGHAGAEHVSRKKCEGCGLKQPSFGLPAEGEKRWCGGCAKGHTGATLRAQ
jgi:LSD1 subclass zinc finger protein